MSVIKICKWCEKELEFNNDKQFGAHLTNCSSNPNKIQRDNDSKKRKLYKFVCSCTKEYEVEMTEYIFGTGKYKKFCSRSCANVREHSDLTKSKISKTLRENPIVMKRVKIVADVEITCKQCVSTKIVKYKPNQIFCSRSCAIKYRNINNDLARNAGRASVISQNRRSKNEVLFGSLCEKQFGLVVFNEPIFNGWDADIIIPEYKIAVLWNGAWHYKKITEKHSLKQVQNRDRIKLFEIEKFGYEPYIIKDMGKYSEEKVNLEFNLFKEWIEKKKRSLE